MFSLAGQVFNVTVQSTGQARAVTNVTQIIRAVEETIREDLRHVQPGRSLIMIQGNPVNAYWTKEGMDSDDDGDPSTGYAHVADPAREKNDPDEYGNPMLIEPRADILMFFTAHKGVSYTDPGVTSNLQQVVYGHAKLGDYVPADGNPPFAFEPKPDAFPVDSISQGVTYPSLTEVSPVPAEDWHLARRGVLLMSAPATRDPSDPAEDFGVHPEKMSPEDYSLLLQGVVDVNGWFSFDEWVMPDVEAAQPWFLPKIFPRKPYVPQPYERSQLDPTPPARLADRLGHYFLPDCASFKVEWTLDPRSEFVDGRLDGVDEIYWFDPGLYDPDKPQIENPLKELIVARDAAAAAWRDAKDAQLKQRLETRYRNLDSLLEQRTLHPDEMPAYSLSDRFLGRTVLDDAESWSEVGPDGRPNTVVFGAARRNVNTGVLVPEDVFPDALRITIDVFDKERRMERPIRHVIVAQVGK